MNPLLKTDAWLFRSHNDWSKLIDRIMACAGCQYDLPEKPTAKRFGLKLNGVFVRFSFGVTAFKECPKAYAYFTTGKNTINVNVARFKKVKELRDVLCHELTHLFDRNNLKFEGDWHCDHPKLSYGELRAHAVQDCFSFNETRVEFTLNRLHRRNHAFFHKAFGNISEQERLVRIQHYNQMLSRVWQSMHESNIPAGLHVTPPEQWECRNGKDDGIDHCIEKAMAGNK